jgi:hypothetical protein
MPQDDRFHLYLLIGQSNMAGRGEVGVLDREVHPRVYALDRARRWVPAADPIHFDKPIAGVGPGLTFGKVMADRDPAASQRVGLIPCAVGGSPIRTWQPGGYWHQTESHPYDDAIARTHAAMAEGTLRGILWHQGESDSNPEDAGQYEERLVALIDRLRSDLGAPGVPFVAATLADFFVERRPEGQVVNQALRRIVQCVPGTACVESGDLAHGGDDLHFGAEAARELGRRYARALIALTQSGDE